MFPSYVYVCTCWYGWLVRVIIAGSLAVESWNVFALCAAVQLRRSSGVRFPEVFSCRAAVAGPSCAWRATLGRCLRAEFSGRWDFSFRQINIMFRYRWGVGVRWGEQLRLHVWSVYFLCRKYLLQWWWSGRSRLRVANVSFYYFWHIAKRRGRWGGEEWRDLEAREEMPGAY